MSSANDAIFDEMDRRDRERAEREARGPRKRYGKPHLWAGRAEAEADYLDAEHRQWCARVKADTRPIPPTATDRNRARWERLEAAGWVPLHRGRGGAWIHPDRRSTTATTAGALALADNPKETATP